MSKIQTRIFNYGNDKESSWPSQFGTGEKGRFVIRDGEVIRAEYANNIDVDAPFVQVDEMPPTQHMHDLKYYTSKKEFRKVTRRCGAEEIGTDVEWRNKPRVDPKKEQKLEEAVAKAYYQVRDNMAPLSELDKARCQIMNKNLRDNNYDRREYDRDGKLRE